MTSTAERAAIPPQKPRRTRMSPEARREQLIEFGLAMLRESPIEDVSIDAIADAAGVSRALLFHYFESKQDFHVSLAQTQARQMLDPAMRAVFDTTRAAMAERIYAYAPALGVEVTPIVRLTVHGWIAFVEEATINWFATQDVTKGELIALVTTALPALATGAALTNL